MKTIVDHIDDGVIFLTTSIRSLISDSLSLEVTHFKPSLSSSNVMVPLLSVSIVFVKL